MSEETKGNEAVAFGLVVAAGLSTAIGSSAVFFPRLAKLGNNRNLASALGLSAGVMTYISLVDIYQKAIGGYEDAGHDEDKAFIYATLSFFGGCVLMFILHAIIGLILKKSGQSMPGIDPDQATPADLSNAETEEVASDGDEVAKDADGALLHMGSATALALALHNFPEGLVTFVGYVEDPAVGIALAVGIAIHNIPEGVCVSMPIYYATGQKWKAFLWGTLSGVTEPLGAVLGWAAFNSSFGGNANGILFGLVGGIMTIISLDELLPMAHKYDPEGGSRITFMVLIGMFLVALSLMLFSL